MFVICTCNNKIRNCLLNICTDFDLSKETDTYELQQNEVETKKTDTFRFHFRLEMTAMSQSLLNADSLQSHMHHQHQQLLATH